MLVFKGKQRKSEVFITFACDLTESSSLLTGSRYLTSTSSRSWNSLFQPVVVVVDPQGVVQGVVRRS